MPKINIITLGCSKNIVDSENLATQINNQNIEFTFDEFNFEADTVVINTCGFINDAKEESINAILEFVEAKNEGKINNLYVMGCLSERYKEELAKDISEVDQFFGVNDIQQIVEQLKIDYKKELIGERVISTPKHFAYLKISEGCDRTCAFCAIPLIRGKHVSVPVELLIRQAENLAKQGVKELILIAQDLTYYGVDIYKKQKLPELVEKLSEIKGLKIIRLHYAYPTSFPEDVLKVMREKPNVAKYLDIPFQHISDNVLAKMKRRHDKSLTISLIKKLKKEVPDIAIRTTLLVGHPGETEKDFEELKEFVREMRFDRLGVFTYSEEENTYGGDNYEDVFRKFAYRQLETPAMENLSTLTGKYGEEGDKLLFKILNSGNFLKKVTDSELCDRNTAKMAHLVAEKGLRYDLTVPFARYIVQHQNEITFPFKRFQIQPVWRADRPQKGRYREFYQCDADIIGSNSLINELEIVQMIDEVFTKLGLKVTIKINNRKLLAGIAERIGYPEKLTDITVAIDKLDKIGLEKVYEELKLVGISEEAIKFLEPILNLGGSFNDQMQCIEKFIGETEIGVIGITEIEKLFSYLDMFKFNNNIELDLTLARGLSYYTGAIFEVVSDEIQIGSICGGGRYDDLTGIFGLKGVSGVGISFGADRIFDVMKNLNRFPESIGSSVKLMFVNFGLKEEKYCLPVLQQLRQKGINSEIYPDTGKMKKQMKYANSNKIPYVALAGENEIQENKFTLKNMETGDQQLVTAEEMIKMLS